MFGPLLRWFLPVLLVGAAACGGRSFEAAGDANGGASHAGVANGGSDSAGTANGGSGNQAGASYGGTHSGGSSTGGTATGGTGASGSAGAAGVGGSCDAFLNEQGSIVQVQITNDTADVIYLGATMQGCGNGPLFEVADAAGRSLVSSGFCQQTCENHIRGTFVGCPAIACVINSVTALNPGESSLQQWNGAFLTDVTLPATCRPADGTTQCQRIEGVKPGVFLFSSQAGTEMDCSQQGAMCAPCTASTTGGCVTYGALISGTMLSAKTKVMLDTSYGVGGSGGGMVRSVEIHFRN